MKPTPSQISYAEHLLKQVGGEVPDFDKMDRNEVSELIDGLKKKRGKPVWYGNGQFSHWDKTTQRVALRVKLAGYFSVGDVILFGKYKNKRGKIVRLFIDEKGNPTLELEPIPKGRKKNKIMGLYKIWKTPEDRVKDRQASLRVAARFQREAAALNDDQMRALLLSLRKGAWGKINSVARLKEVLDRLGGWSVEPFVGLVQVHIDKYPTRYFDDDRAKVEKIQELAKKMEVRSLPSNPKIDEPYTMDVGDVEESHGYEVEFRLWVGAAGFKVTSPEGKILELLPDGDFWLKGRTWINLSDLAKLGKRSGKYIRLYDVPKWLKNETHFEKQLLETLGMEEHKPSQGRTRENTGSCPCCFRNIKLKTQSGKEHPLMVNHGFQRPGWGYIVGNCVGVGWPPFELSSDGTKHLVHEILKPRVLVLTKYLSDLGSGKIREIQPQSTWGTSKKITPESPNWDSVLKNEISQNERELGWLKEDIKTLEQVISTWKARPLPEPGHEVKVLKLRTP